MNDLFTVVVICVFVGILLGELEAENGVAVWLLRWLMLCTDKVTEVSKKIIEK